jgi:two-component sensor histidine kinase
MVNSVARTLLRRFARKLPVKPPTVWKGQLAAILCVAVGAGARFAIDPWVHDNVRVVLFYPCVIVASIWGGALAGLSAIVISAAIADYLWLPPRGSFSLSPSSALTLMAFAFVCLFCILIARLFSALVELHVEAEERAVLLAHELRHRAANLLGVVQAISAQTARNASTVEEHQMRFSSRLAALSRAQRLVAENPESPPGLREVLFLAIEPVGIARFLLEGPAIPAPAFLETSCALLMHELSTNALKYGALSVPDGRVTIRWETKGNAVRLDWREFEGPPVIAPTRAGFGSRLLETAFPSEYGGATIAFNPDGVHCTVRFALL